MSPRVFLIVGIVLIVIGGVALYAGRITAPNELTPEGPMVIVDPSWLTYSDDSVTFRYPAELPTTYIHSVDWPPKVTVLEGTTACTEGKNRMGETKQTTIDGHEYCVTVSSEGAAGSVYLDYLYATQLAEKTVTLAFTLREVQCANYDDLQKAACERERITFNIDDPASLLIQSVRYK